MLAFHEAFADIVALFQHFSLPDVLRHQIAATRGDLASQNKLGRAGAAVRTGDRQARRAAKRDRRGRRDDRRVAAARARPRGLRAAHRAARPWLAARRRRLRRLPHHLQGARRRPAADRERGDGRASRRAAAPGPGQPAGGGGGALRAAGARDVHPRARLLPAGRHHLRRLPARGRHGGLRVRSGRRGASSRRVRRGVPPLRHRPGERPHAFGGRPALAAGGGRARRGRERRDRPRQELGRGHRLLEPGAKPRGAVRADAEETRRAARLPGGQARPRAPQS